MYLIPVLVAIDAADARTAEAIVQRELRERAVFVGAARRLSPAAAATAAFELVVLVNNIQLPPARDTRG